MNTRSHSNTVYSERDGTITSVVLNRPHKLNALTAIMIDAVRNALKTAQGDPDTRVVILRGEGKAFCAGDDLSDLAGAVERPDEQAGLVANLQDVTRQIMGGPKPVVAVVQGWAVGAAFSWVLNCDLAVFAESSKAFFQEVIWGVSPTGAATVLAPALLGAGRARDAFLLSRRWSARELLGFGVATRVVADGQEIAEALAMARQLAELSPFALAGLKKLTSQAIASDLDGILAREAALAVETSSRQEVAQRLANRGAS
jgi:enoyl-CoA hydratase/carnithine racemase